MQKGIFVGVAILGVVFIFVYMAEAFGQGNPQVDSPHNEIMVVFYDNTDDTVIGWARYDPELEIIDVAGEMTVISSDIGMRGVDSTIVDYGFYKYKEIAQGGEVTLDDLNLEPVEASDLPFSEHIAKVKEIVPTRPKPVTVTRKFMGQTYDVNCLISQTVRQLYQDGKVGVGDFVIVSFIEEHPNEAEIHVPIVTDKVFKSWN
jgi:hypothetical protein